MTFKTLLPQLLNQLDGPNNRPRIRTPKDDDDDDDDDEDQGHHEGPSRSELNVHLPGESISAYDICRLVIVGLLYLILAGVAVTAVVYSVLSILDVLRFPVRSVTYQRTNRYPPILIVIVPDFSTYYGCYMRYFDDISPHPAYNSTVGSRNCTYTNITFTSSKLNVSRFAMVFQSPTDVANKQILCINYTINTTVRDYSAIEYWMFDDWNSFDSSNETEKEEILAQSELTQPIHTFPAGMRTQVKLSKIEDNVNNLHSVRFQVEPNFARYNREEAVSGVSHLQVMFEWSSPIYEVYKTVLPLSFWSAVGSICGVLITIWKLAEVGTSLTRKFRRERKKIKQRIKKKEEEKAKLQEEYSKTNVVPSLPSGATFDFVNSDLPLPDENKPSINDDN